MVQLRQIMQSDRYYNQNNQVNVATESTQNALPASVMKSPKFKLEIQPLKKQN